MSVGQIKQHPFGKFLNKPFLKQLSAKHQRFDDQLLMSQWPDASRSFEISFGQWGDEKKDWHRNWNQASRKGAHLVLQVNFSADHDRAQHNFKKDWGYLDCNYSCHPVRKNGRPTLAWARIDIDWESGEALIEEIQSDWVTGLLDSRKRYNRMKERFRRDKKKLGQDQVKQMAALERYLNALRFEVKYWPEMTLYAAIELLHEELGIRKIWYHTPESGVFVKRAYGSPKSHYHDLPRRLGFKRVSDWPAFIRKGWGARRKHVRERCEQLTWHYLEF